jgi:hypothetical protein
MIKRKQKRQPVKKAPKRPVGAPPFEFSDKIRNKVARLAAANMTQADIARVVGCNIITLVKHFKHELAGKPIIEKPPKVGKRNQQYLDALEVIETDPLYAPPDPPPRFGESDDE